MCDGTAAGFTCGQSLANVGTVFLCGVKTGIGIVVGDIDWVNILIITHDVAFLGINGELVAFGCARRHWGRPDAWGAMSMKHLHVPGE